MKWVLRKHTASCLEKWDTFFPGKQVILWDVIGSLCDVTKKRRGFKNVMARMQKDKPEHLFMLASLLIGLKLD